MALTLSFPHAEARNCDTGCLILASTRPKVKRSQSGIDLGLPIKGQNVSWGDQIWPAGGQGQDGPAPPPSMGQHVRKGMPKSGPQSARGIMGQRWHGPLVAPLWMGQNGYGVPDSGPQGAGR